MKALKNILKKNRPSSLLIQSLCAKLDLDIAIVNSAGTAIWGSPGQSFPFSFSIVGDQEEVAVLHATTEGGKEIAEMINLLLNKEIEKRKIGTEILGLYREINMIYDFSEKISEKIDVGSIADTT